MQTMDTSLANLVLSGSITMATAESRSSNPEELRKLVQSGPIGGVYGMAA